MVLKLKCSVQVGQSRQVVGAVVVVASATGHVTIAGQVTTGQVTTGKIDIEEAVEVVGAVEVEVPAVVVEVMEVMKVPAVVEEVVEVKVLAVVVEVLNKLERSKQLLFMI